MAASDVATIYSGNTAYFKDIKDKAFSALTSLESAALGIANSSVNYVTVGVYDPAQLDRLDINGLPTIQEVMGSISSINADSFPEAPNTGDLDKYKKHVWESSQLDAIQSTLMGYVDSMGMPTKAQQDAIFDQGKERLNRTLSDQIDLIAAKTSASGFKYANGQTNAMIERLMVDNQDNLTDRSRKIDELMTVWAKDNLQFALQQGMAAEVAHMDFAYKYSSIFREIYTTLITSILEKYRTQVQMELARIDATIKTALMRTDVLKANGDIIATEGKLQLEKNRLEIEQANQQFNGNISLFSHRANAQIQALAQRAVTSGGLVQAVSNSVIGVMR